MPPEGVRLHQYKAEAPALKLMKDCAAKLSKVYGVTMVDGFTDTGRLQGNRTHGVEGEARMAEDEVAMDEMAEPEGGDGRGLGGFAAGVAPWRFWIVRACATPRASAIGWYAKSSTASSASKSPKNGRMQPEGPLRGEFA